MDREQVMGRLQPFLHLSRQEGKPLEIVRLDDAFPGLPGNGYVVHLLAPWAAGVTFSDTMDAVFDLFWRSTDVSLRKEVVSLNVKPRREEIAAQFASWA